MRKAAKRFSLFVFDGIAFAILWQISVDKVEDGWSSPWILGALAVVVIVNVVLLYPEIKEMRDPAARIYRRGVEKSESNKRQRAKTMIEHVRRMPVAGRTCYEPSTGTVIAEIKWPRPIRRRVMRCATWLVNCRLMPKVVYFGVVRRLGYQYKESDEGYPLGKD